jgi:hypothetical protein
MDFVFLGDCLRLLESAGKKTHLKVQGQAFHGYMSGLDVGESFGSTPKEKSVYAQHL